MDTRQVAVGGLLLFISAGVLLETGVVEYTPLLIAGTAGLGIATGSLLVGATGNP